MGNPIDLLAPGRLRVGPNRQSTADMGIRAVAETNARGENHFDQYTADALGPDLVLAKARGTAAAPGDVVQNDQLGGLQFQATSTTRFTTASVESYVDDAVVAGQRPASRLEIRTNTNNAAPVLRAYVSKEGFIAIGSSFAPAVAATRAAFDIHGAKNDTDGRFKAQIEGYGVSADGPYIAVAHARGTFAAPANNADGDNMGDFEWYAYAGGWQQSAEIRAFVSGAVVNGVTPDTNMQFKVATGGAMSTRLTLFPTGQIAMGSGSRGSATDLANNGLGTLWVSENSAQPQICFHSSATNAVGSQIVGRKSRGASMAAPTNVVNGDVVALYGSSAYSGAWFDLGHVEATVDAAVVNNQRPASRLGFWVNANNTAPFEAMRITSAGIVYIGTGSVDTNRLFHVQQATTGFAPILFQITGGGANANAMRITAGDNSVTGSAYEAFHRPDGTQIGSISQNGASTVAYNTSSDERLKENISDLAAGEGLQIISSLRPRSFNFKGDKSKAVVKGFIAQEVYKILPQVVHVGGAADCACDLSEGKEHDPECCHVNPWGMDYGHLTPVLVKAVQELNDRLKAIGA